MKAVAAIHQINTGAASMRLTRIKKALGSAAEKTKADNDGDESAAGEVPKSPHTPKVKATKANKLGSVKTEGSLDGVLTPSPETKGKTKSKKRKLNEEEQVDALIQRAGLEALQSGGTDAEVKVEEGNLGV